MHIFPQLVKSLHIFPPIELKFAKLKERPKIFPLRREPPHYNKFPLGKNMNQEGGGGGAKI